MNNDLISREALKKAIEECKYCGFYGKLIEIINNAPTVNYPFYQEAYQTGYEEGKNARLQGEWIVKTISTFPQYQPDEYICPFCKTIVNYKTDFCHKCGSDMRGRAEND
jgi:ribosomal protein L37AE/L43A